MSNSRHPRFTDSPFEKGVVVGLEGTEQGYWPGSGVHSRPKPIKWTPKFRAVVRKSVVGRLSKRAVKSAPENRRRNTPRPTLN
jgi:hypothetical protein